MYVCVCVFVCVCVRVLVFIGGWNIASVAPRHFYLPEVNSMSVRSLDMRLNIASRLRDLAALCSEIQTGNACIL